MTKAKMTLKEAMELIEALKAEKAEAVEKAEKAEAEAAEAKNQLETELRKADNDEFDKAIRPKFDFFEYAVPGLGFEKKHDYVGYCDITFTANELLNMMKAHKPGGQYWEMREKSAEEFVIDLKHAIANKHKNANRPQFVFFREKIIRALPPVKTPVARTMKTAVKKTTAAVKKTTAATKAPFDPEAILNNLAAAGLAGVYKRRREFKVTFENVSWNITANARGGYTHYVGTRPVQTYATAEDMKWAMVH